MPKPTKPKREPSVWVVEWTPAFDPPRWRPAYAITTRFRTKRDAISDLGDYIEKHDGVRVNRQFRVTEYRRVSRPKRRSKP